MGVHVRFAMGVHVGVHVGVPWSSMLVFRATEEEPSDILSNRRTSNGSRGLYDFIDHLVSYPYSDSRLSVFSWGERQTPTISPGRGAWTSPLSTCQKQPSRADGGWFLDIVVTNKNILAGFHFFFLRRTATTCQHWIIYIPSVNMHSRTRDVQLGIWTQLASIALRPIWAATLMVAKGTRIWSPSDSLHRTKICGRVSTTCRCWAVFVIRPCGVPEKSGGQTCKSPIINHSKGLTQRFEQPLLK
jgi:hypothetical protein